MTSGMRTRRGMQIISRKQGLNGPSDFDLPDSDTYYTRPMPPPWSKPLDIERVSRGEAAFEFHIALEDLARVAARADQVGGNVSGIVRFGRHHDTATAHVVMHGTAIMRCQKCMQPVSLPVSSSVRMALLQDAGGAGAVPEPFEPVLAAGGWISVGELVEEELLLSLPIVPLHGAQTPCGLAANAGADEQETPAEAVTQRPFAALGKLLSQK